MSVRNPRSKLLVWALPISLAATLGIEVSFFSYGYLDVSVPRVALVQLWIHCTITAHYCNCVPAFGYPWVCGCLLLTMAFRSLPRPSSAPIAKAFTLCSSSLNLFYLSFSSISLSPLPLSSLAILRCARSSFVALRDLDEKSCVKTKLN